METELVERCQAYLSQIDPDIAHDRAVALRELAAIRLQRLLEEEDHFGFSKVA